MQADIVSFVDNLPAGRIVGRVQLLGDRGLSIGHHRLAGELLGRNEERRPSLPGYPRAVVDVPLAIHAGAQSHLAQQRDGARLKHASPDPPQHVSAALPFQHDTIDAVAMEDVRQKRRRDRRR